MEVAERIGRRVKDLREERAWTQHTLAQKVAASQSTIAGVESGAQLPGTGLLSRMADVFRVGLDFFYREERSPFEMLLRAEEVTEADRGALREITERCLRYREIEKMAGVEVESAPQYAIPTRGGGVVMHAERIAEQERLRLDLGFDQPLDLPRVLEQQGVRVLGFESSSDLDGLFLSSEEEGAFALVNTAKPKNRQLFTLAHEYGHILLHRGLGTRLDYDVLNVRQKGDYVEMAAGAFAAAFLMPDFAVKELWNKKERSPTARLVWLKRSFGVSYRALGWRLLNLGIITKAERESMQDQEDQLRDAEKLLYEGNSEPCVEIPRLSDRLKFLAQRAYLAGEVSTSKLAGWLETDIVTADLIAHTLRGEEEPSVPAAG